VTARRVAVGDEEAPIASSAAIWIAAPLAIGTVRTISRDIR
jgi:hypothetical protein